MADSVPIMLDRERRVRLDFNALSDADQVAGERINELLTGAHAGISAMRALLWAGLRHEDRSLTIEATGDLINQYLASGGTLVDLRIIINQALLVSGLIGNGDDGAKNGQPETQNNP